MKVRLSYESFNSGIAFFLRLRLPIHLAIIFVLANPARFCVTGTSEHT